MRNHSDSQRRGRGVDQVYGGEEMNECGIHWERQNVREVEWRQHRLQGGGADGGGVQAGGEGQKLIQPHLLVVATRPERQRTRLLEGENEKNKGRANESRDAEKSDSERLNKDAG